MLRPPTALLATLAALALPFPALSQAEEVEDRARAEDGPEAVETAPLTAMERIGLLASEDDTRSAGERFRDFVDLLYRYTLGEFPEIAPVFGVDEGQDRWTDSSYAAIQRRKRETVRALEVLETIDRNALEDLERLDYDLLHRRLGSQVRGQAFPGELLPISQLGGIQQEIAATLADMPRRTVADCERILARLDAVGDLVDGQLELLRRGLARGVTPPRVTLRDVPQQLLNLIPDDPFASPLLQAFRELPGTIPSGERQRLANAARAAYLERVKPALEKLHRYFSQTYLASARTTIAMKDLPGGEDWYAHLAKVFTTTDLTPQEIHDLGLGEVERIRAEMEKLIVETGFQGDFVSFNDFLRTHSGFFYEDPEEMLRDYRDIAKRADGALLRLFSRLPRMPYGVEPMPSYAARSQTAAYYDSGALEAGRSATFYVNTFDLKSRPNWRMESLTLHEAVPGHHLQISIAREREDVAWFRRLGGETAYVEGWALYAESLGGEMGLYKDPYQRYGQLTSELWRALRLVVDTGLHVFGWSRQQTIDYLYGLTGRSEHEVVVEVDRYIVMPGQALAYKVGELRIREIRARAEKELGERFELRDFHDALLGDGALPLDVLEGKMDDWIAERKAETALTSLAPISSW